jgi:signal peptidase II
VTATRPKVVNGTGSRVALITTVLLLAALDLGIKALAEHALAGGQVADLGVLQLRLTYNPGVAFSVGAALPASVVLTVTGLITTVLAVYAWRAGPTLPLLGRLGLAAVLAGAVANVLDRAVDGAVTDYLHTGWWPTFNLADVFITCGGAALVWATLRSGTATARTAPDHPG